MTEPSQSSQTRLDAQLSPQGEDTEFRPDLTGQPDGSQAGSAADPDFGPPSQEGDLGKLGRFRVLKQLGRGGMGAVYLGFDAGLHRKVALKVMLPKYAANESARERFLREARAAAQIKSDHVVTIFDVGDERNIPFIAMEYLQGHPLDDYLMEKGNVPVEHIIRIGREMAEGLAEAHTLGLIHRDIKPGNIWLEAPSGRVKILDFGLARQESEDIQITQSGMVVGTPAYMSPEQARAAKIDARSDLFSLGAVLYRLCTGRLPFNGATTMAILTSLAVDTPIPVRQLNPEVPNWLASVIHRLLAKNPDQRFQNASDVADALRQATITGSGKPAPVVEPMAISVQTRNIWAGIDDEAENLATEEVAAPVAAKATPKQLPRPKIKKKADSSRALIAILGALVAVMGLLVAAVVLHTPKGTLIIETDDPDVEVVVKKDGAVIRDKTRDRQIELKVGEYGIELAEQKEGLRLNTDNFEITKGGKVTVRARIDKKPKEKIDQPAIVRDADRLAAEYVLSIGGKVQINGQDREYTSEKQLPRSVFQLTSVDLDRNEKVTDEGLAVFNDCKNLNSLVLQRTSLGDEAMSHFANCKNLTHLALTDTRVGDAGLANFKNCKNLYFVDLGSTQVTDAGLVIFKNCKSMDHLDLGNCQITDVGLVHLKGLTTLRMLTVAYSPVTDKGLAELKHWRKLGDLNLSGTKVTDVGLAYFKECKDFTGLHLNDTNITDKGIDQFKDHTSLLGLDLKKTAVTANKIDELKTRLPQCRIEWDGGVIEPVQGDRKAAEYVLSIGGTVAVVVNGMNKEVRAVKDLPGELFVLTEVNLSRNQKVTDDALAVFAGCKSFKSILLEETGVSDAGLAHFKNPSTLVDLALYGNRLVTDVGLSNFRNCPNIRGLYLDNTGVTDKGLAYFKECQLVVLGLSGTKITDDGLGRLKNCQGLNFLNVAVTPVGNKGLEHFKGCTQLLDVNLTDTQVTDDGLAYLDNCKSLSYLHLEKTRISRERVEELKKKFPKCKIDWDGK
jgi:Leucine-rich repeat (LRR) protein/predicted Ser/Thr protein kinase